MVDEYLSAIIRLQSYILPSCIISIAPKNTQNNLQ